MIARIRTENGFYNSVVFALFKKRWWRGSDLLVFNKDCTALQLVDMSMPQINALIYNVETDENWVIKKRVEGYDWILESISGKFPKIKIDNIDLDRCKALQAAVEDNDWFELKNEADVRGLIDVAHGFFNGRVKDIYVEEEKQYISFDTTWGYDIVFALDGNIETNLVKGFGAIRIDGELHIIYGATVFFENGLTYWVCDEAVKSTKDLDKARHYYFCANKIQWEIIIQSGF